MNEVDNYRAIRDRYLAAGDRADVAFAKWFAGDSRSAAAASRLANVTNGLSAELASAESALYRIGVDPASVDAEDSITRDYF